MISASLLEHIGTHLQSLAQSASAYINESQRDDKGEVKPEDGEEDAEARESQSSPSAGLDEDVNISQQSNQNQQKSLRERRDSVPLNFITGSLLSADQAATESSVDQTSTGQATSQDSKKHSDDGTLKGFSKSEIMVL